MLCLSLPPQLRSSTDSDNELPRANLIMDQSDRQLRFEVINFWLDNCRPPTTQDLASKGGRDEADVRRGLKRLEELHHLKLYGDEVPSPTPIAMAHPFSHL